MKNFLSKFSFFIITVVLLLIFFHWLGFLNPVLGGFQKAVNPVQKFFYNVSVKSQVLFSTAEDPKKENEALKTRLEKFTVDQVKLELLARENEILRHELDFLNKKKYQYAFANIIGRGSGDEHQVFIIDKGESHNIKNGYPVIFTKKSEALFQEPAGFLLGKIIKVTRNSSQVLLLTDNKSLVAATISRDQEVSGLVKGERGLTLRLDLVPLDKEIKEGDFVITSGLEDFIPLGLIIGEIEKIESRTGDFFQKAQVRPLVSFDNLGLVSVLITGD